jgi:hypothetical protein
MTHKVADNGCIEIEGWEKLDDGLGFFQTFSDETDMNVCICINRLEPGEPWFAYLTGFGWPAPVHGEGTLREVTPGQPGLTLTGFDYWLNEEIGG